MAGQKKHVETQAEKKKRPAPKQESAIRPGNGASALESAPGMNGEAVHGAMDESQVTWLGNRQLQSVQRAALASYIGQIQGNARLQRLVPRVRTEGGPHLQRSALSEELNTLWCHGQRAEFFERLRRMTVSDAEVEDFVRLYLTGNDQWLASNILRFGPEANWPVHVKVEHAMKGLAESRGKAEVFNLLRAANGSQAGNQELQASINRVFAAGTDDLWLAQKLQQHGIETSWPIHLKIEREMKGWAESRGQDQVFRLIRAENGAQAGNPDLQASIDRIFAAGSDERWLAHNLRQYGEESHWPVHLKIEREMKPWAESHGQDEVFRLIRAENGAQANNADLQASIDRIFAAGTDERWLGHNLRQYGEETRWPIHLQIEREMKPWAGCRGKDQVFTLLRNAAGAEAGNQNLAATLNRIFAAGTDDLALAINLSKYGPEQSWPVPTKDKVFPYDLNPHSSPGEQIIFGAEYTYPLPEAILHKLVYNVVGGTLDTPTGPTTKTINGLVATSQSFFINPTWNGVTPVIVNLEVQVRSNNHTATSECWIFTKSTHFPTIMTQVEGEDERPLPSEYNYQIGPGPSGGGAAQYHHQTILERFEPSTCNITVDELKPEFRTAHPGIQSAQDITEHFFGATATTGTFTVEADDTITDEHAGGMPGIQVFRNALIAMKEIHMDLPQIYEAQPGVPLGKYLIRRIMKPSGEMKLKKTKQA